MHDAQPAVAVLLRRHDRAEGHDVAQLLEVEVVALHLLPDRVRRLFAADDLGFQVVATQRLAELLDDAGNQHAAVLAQELQARDDQLPRVRVELGERQVLQLVLHLLHTHALRQRRIDVHRFRGDAPAFVMVVQEFQRAHVVQPVGQLDQQHADVLGHRQDQLAEVFRLLRMLRLQLDAIELGDAVDQARHLGAEQTLDVGDGGAGVFDGVVQQRRDDRRGIQPVVGEDAGHFKRMREVGVAIGAGLRAVRLPAGVARSAAMMSVRCATSRTSISTRISKNCMRAVGDLQVR